MTQISFYDDGTGKFIKQWPCWTGVVPAVGDVVVLHFGDDNEDEQGYVVKMRVIDGTRPDSIRLFVEKVNP